VTEGSPNDSNVTADPEDLCARAPQLDSMLFAVSDGENTAFISPEMKMARRVMLARGCYATAPLTV
jgi:hypothetical protein